MQLEHSYDRGFGGDHLAHVVAGPHSWRAWTWRVCNKQGAASQATVPKIQLERPDAGMTTSPEFGKLRRVLRANAPPFAVIPVLQPKQLVAYLLHPQFELLPVHLLLVLPTSRTWEMGGRPATSPKPGLRASGSCVVRVASFGPPLSIYHLGSGLRCNDGLYM